MELQQIKEILAVIKGRVEQVESPIFYKQITGERIQKIYAERNIDITTNEAIAAWAIASDNLFAAGFMEDDGFTDDQIIMFTKNLLIRCVIELVVSDKKPKKELDVIYKTSDGVGDAIAEYPVLKSTKYEEQINTARSSIMGDAIAEWGISLTLDGHNAKAAIAEIKDDM